MRFIIFAPPYRHNSAGIRALYLLRDYLVGYGEDALVMSFEERFPLVDGDVVIYPEIVVGNPLGAKKVVRWVLCDLGRLGGDTDFDDELVFAWDNTLMRDGYAGILEVPVVEDFFFDDSRERVVNCYYVGKGKFRPHGVLDGCVEITSSYPESREALAELLQSTKVLYTFDDFSGLSTEAVECGACVKVIKKDIEDFALYKDPDDVKKNLPSQLEYFIRKVKE